MSKSIGVESIWKIFVCLYCFVRVNGWHVDWISEMGDKKKEMLWSRIRVTWFRDQYSRKDLIGY